MNWSAIQVYVLLNSLALCSFVFFATEISTAALIKGPEHCFRCNLNTEFHREIDSIEEHCKDKGRSNIEIPVFG